MVSVQITNAKNTSTAQHITTPPGILYTESV
ncbi:Uncharacterised protein [Mycobacterium tuberculosis]|nr:Uncharacterised protein [Mycobacterium tuberculosis]